MPPSGWASTLYLHAGLGGGLSGANDIVYAALALYLPFTAFCFARWGGRRGMLVALFAGWILLPWYDVVGRSIPILHSKHVFVPGVVLAASLLLDAPAWRGLRFRWFDLPVVVASVGPFFTSLATGRGPYDGASSMLESFLTWGAPWLLGRAYLGSPAALLDGAKAIVLGGLASLPLCLWEIRMSPQLHRQLYGFHQHNFAQHVRDGHYRPMLFLAHGLMVAMFMAGAALVSYWLWRSRGVKRVYGVPLAGATPALVVAAFLCRSVGATVLLVVGLAVLEGTRWLKAPVLALALAVAPAGYCALRIQGWDTAPLLAQANRWFGPNRAESLRIRLVNEQDLVNRDLQRPWLGWGKWNDSRLRDEEGRDRSIVDSMWILLLGTSGVVGLASVGLLLALPLLALWRSVPARLWGAPPFAPAAALAVLAGIWAVDDLVNAMASPVFPLLAGGVLSFCVGARAWLSRRAQARAAAPVRPSPPPTALPAPP